MTKLDLTECKMLPVNSKATGQVANSTFEPETFWAFYWSGATVYDWQVVD